MASGVASILAGLGTAGLILFVIINRDWVGRRLPLLFLCILVILLWLIRPAQLNDVFVAMVDQRQYMGIAGGFFILALIPFAIAAVQLEGMRLSTWDTIVCLFPAVALAVLGALSAPRSAYLSIPAILAGWIAARWSPLASAAIGSRKNAVLASLGLLYGLLLFYLACDPIRFPTALGSVVIFSLGILFLALILTTILQYPRSALGFLLVWLAIGAFNKGFASIEVGKGQKGRSPKEALEAWLTARHDIVDDHKNAQQPVPVIILSAEGGGIYAAAHSFLGYRALTHYCPEFKRHVFANVGVSGGALGFVMERALSEPLTSKECRDDAAPSAVPEPIVADLLSPVLANLLLLQPVAWLIPFWNTLPDGGSVLAKSVSSAIGSARDNMSKPEDAAMLFVTTDARSGSRVVFSPISFKGSGDVHTFSIDEERPDTTVQKALIQAAVTSARFPFLTQSAVLDDTAARRVLVDGGYADNTGALTASNLISALRNIVSVSFGKDDCGTRKIVFAAKFTSRADWSDCQLPLFLAHVSFAADATVDMKPATDPTIADPLLALLSARVDEARRALIGLEERQRNPALEATAHVDNGFYAHRIAQVELALPLGWRLSPSRTSALLKDIAPIHLCEVNANNDGTRSGAAEQQRKGSSNKDEESLSFEQERNVRREAIRRRTGCSMRVLMRLFDSDYRVSIDAFN